jgi:hypothetical protein
MNYQDLLDLYGDINAGLSPGESYIFWSNLARKYNLYSPSIYIILESMDKDKIVKDLLRQKLLLL